MSPPSLLTLPQRHLSLGKARWWMQVGGWYACSHFCVRFIVKEIEKEREKIAACSILYVHMCASCSVPTSLLAFSLSLSLTEWIFCVLYYVVPLCLPHIPASRDLPGRDAICSVRLRPVLRPARPLSEQVADCGTKAKALSVQSRG